MLRPNPQHILLLHYFREFLQAAARRGLRVAPLKGAHLITSVYPAQEDRGPMSDVDCLVPPEEFRRAGELLTELGYHRRELPTRRATEAEFYEAGYALELGRGRRVFLELHRHLAQPRRHPVDYVALWRRAGPSTLDGAPCLRLAPEDHLLHGVIHLTTDCFVSPARGLRDLELLVRRGGADLAAATDRSRRWRCARALWLALRLLDAGPPGDREVPPVTLGPALASLAPPLPVAAALTRLVPDARGFRLAALGKRTRQGLLWPLLFDDLGHLAGFCLQYALLRGRDLTARCIT